MTQPTMAFTERYAALGLSVIPLDHPAAPIANDRDQIGKVSAVRWKRYQSTRAGRDEFRGWFGNGTPRNIGIVTGPVGCVVAVDTDSLEGNAWVEANLPATPMMTETAKGRHRFYRHPGTPVPNKVRIRDGVDIRGDGGYVVAPGSVHVSGHVYREVQPWPDSIDALPTFDPAWLGMAAPSLATNDDVPIPAHLGSSQVTSADRAARLKRAQAYLSAVPPAIEGQGGDLHTYQVCCRVVRGFGLDASDARQLLEPWNARCVPPWSAAELDAKIASALRYGRELIGAKVVDRPLSSLRLGRSEGPPSLAPVASEADARGSLSANDRDAHFAEKQSEAVSAVGRPMAADTFPLTDTGNAEALAAWYGDRLRYDHAQRRCLVWEGHRFRPDADAALDRIAKDVIRRRQAEALASADESRRTAALKWSLLSEARQRREAMIALAQSERPIADAGASWDADQWLLGVPNGVVDLRTGTLRDGQPSDRITLQAGVPYQLEASCRLWLATITDILNGDEQLVAYLQRALGYSLTGHTAEHVLWMAHGAGSNGKSTLLGTVAYVMGDYSHVMPFSTVLAQPTNAPTNDLAALAGRRFVQASEARDGAKLDEARIKMLTGGDTVTARFLHQEFFTFQPTLKLWLSVNHRPIVRDDSYSFWRRMRLLPFTRTFAVNPTLADDLKAEGPGILAWLVRGALLWQAEGLNTPDAVTAATTAYKDDSDVLSEFLTDACDLDAEASIGAAEFYRGYLAWAERQGYAERERMTRQLFGRKAAERFPKVKTRTVWTYSGVALRRCVPDIS